MIVVAGSANIDLVARVSHQLQPGETLLAEDYAMHQGGKGANQAVAAARLGAQVRFAGAVGDDAFGAQILADLKHEGVDTSGMRQFPGSSGLALITVDAAGENEIVVVPGAYGKLTADVDDAAFAGADVVLTQLEIPPAFVNAVLAAGRRSGAEVVLNAAPATSLAAFDMANVDWLLVNTGEAAQLASADESDDREQIAAQARDLSARHGVNVIVTLGADGALWMDRQGAIGHVPGRSCEVVDTTGAGDTFAGAFAYARACGQSAEMATRTAVAAGSLSVGKAGARAGMPALAELQAVLAAE